MHMLLEAEPITKVWMKIDPYRQRQKFFWQYKIYAHVRGVHWSDVDVGIQMTMVVENDVDIRFFQSLYQ